MISRRNFVIIVVMMLVLLFMFQFSQIIKENGNEYEVNEYNTSELLSGYRTWKGLDKKEYTNSDGTINYARLVQNEYVCYFGDEKSAQGDIVKQWCTYTKHTMLCSDSKIELPDNEMYYPAALLIDGSMPALVSQLKEVEKYTKAGIPVIFCSVPDVQTVKENYLLRKILGITEVREDETEIEGVRLFEGFLVGGEAYYIANSELTKGQQDLDLTIPWYIPGVGSKTYMVGLKDDEEVIREEFPRIIWRSAYNDSMVFAINGDYCESVTGLGILDAFMYECNDYVLYPVIDAQGFSVVDYPSLANENSEVMEQVYSRNTKSFMRDIAWPSLLAMTLNNRLQLTCFVGTKQDYSDPAEPDAKQLVFYLQQMKEVGAEAGRSLRHFDSISLAGKVQRDDKFYQDSKIDYNFGAYFLDQPSLDFETYVLAKDQTHNIHSVTCADRGKYPLVGFYTSKVTLLGVTADAREYSFSKDLQLRSLNTALGYSNTLIDMHDVIWPEDEDHQWQNLFEVISSNVSTYYSKLNIFDQTPMSQTDYRARVLLNLDYRHSASENEINLYITNADGESWFLLRTHGKKPTFILNGDYREIEKDVYLIHGTKEWVRITTANTDDNYSYKGPFR